jgi:glucose uptake protein
MFIPQTYQAALLLMFLSMICWGSWANTLKLAPGFRFQLFYWDYVIGLTAGAVIWGLTAGSVPHLGLPFLDAVKNTSGDTIAYAICGGIIFNIANLLLVAAIDVAGLAVAFPVGIGLALIVGTISSYIVHPAANPTLLFGGVALVTVAIVLDAAAYRKREQSAKAATKRGIVLSLIAGLLMGSFYPLVAHAMGIVVVMPGGIAPFWPGPYAIAFFFAIGVLISTIPANLALMARPLDGKPPVSLSGYWSAPFGWHVAGWVGGAIWATGAIANFVASQTHFVGPAVSYSIGQGATMVSAFWGVFIWREFAGSPPSAKLLLFFMFVFFLLGLSSIALAPLH